MTEQQQRIVEENMGLVGKVIRDKVHGLGQPGVPEYEELFQTGCIGLCKAALSESAFRVMDLNCNFMGDIFSQLAKDERMLYCSSEERSMKLMGSI